MMTENGGNFIQLMARLMSRATTVAALLQPVTLLVVRLWIGAQFFPSGLAKLKDWESTLALFTSEHPVPYLSPQLAAVSGTFFELLCPILIWAGLGTRFATLPLLAMTGVIEFTYLHHKDHQVWAMMLLILLAFGAGRWSFDHWIKSRFPAGS